MQLTVLLTSLKTKEAPDISSVEKYFVNTDSAIWGSCICTAESDLAELPRTTANYKKIQIKPTKSNTGALMVKKQLFHQLWVDKPSTQQSNISLFEHKAKEIKIHQKQNKIQEQL